ncbi:hypothetical protein EWM64_g2759 [Hericium alpestre]|uniref:Uncharacterized protein n=1 Tax=Hericium alpestre TaxID=135208 RepID=A0A4Z0A5Q1_9AGAM|nr:hypothetical protein EWM64_g2759 [Hericium alpestre]
MHHSSTPGPSRRWSPISLSSAQFGAGAEQAQGMQHGYVRTSSTNATTNTHYPYAMQAGYTNYTQTAESSLYTHITGTSSSYQHTSGLHPTNNHRPGDDTSSHKGKMTSMTGRMRLPIGGNAQAEAVPQSSRVGEKRKDRASSPSTSDAEALPFRKKEALRVKGHRKNRTEAIAELAERLPSHLQVYEAPSVKHIRQAIVHIDEQTARIGRLENENAQFRAAQVHLTSENYVIRKKNETLLDENDFLQRAINEKDTRIRQLEGGRQR